jgi:acetyl esterase
VVTAHEQAPCAGGFDPLYAERLPLLDGLAAPSLLAPLDTADQAARRAAFDAPFGPADLPAVRTTDAVIRGPHGGVPIRIYRPLTDADARPALVWIHGGAWVFGDLEMPEGDHTARRVADLADAVVVCVDYRLALGGVHFPIPHDDCWAAYEWVREHAAEWGVDPARIAVGGGSAGGNLAASVALRGRDSGTPPAQVLLVYPALHAGPPPLSDALVADLARTPQALIFGLDDSFTVNFLGGPVSAATPYAFPAAAASLVGYPPTYIENVQFDSLRASGEDFAARLASDGVEVELTTTCGVPHGHLNDVGLPAAVDTCRRLAARLRRP